MLEENEYEMLVNELIGKKFKDEIVELQNKVRALKIENQNLKKSPNVVELESTAKILKIENRNLRQRLTEQAAEIDDKQKQIREAKKETIELKRELSELRYAKAKTTFYPPFPSDGQTIWGDY